MGEGPFHDHYRLLPEQFNSAQRRDATRRSVNRETSRGLARSTLHGTERQAHDSAGSTRATPASHRPRPDLVWYICTSLGRSIHAGKVTRLRFSRKALGRSEDRGFGVRTGGVRGCVACCPAGEWGKGEMDERAATASDRAFLLEVYADSRRAELACLGWSAEQMAHFVEMQFGIQQRGYQLQFPSAEQSILLCDGEPAGQWRVERGAQTILLVDIALLERFRGRGIGSACIAQLCREALSRGSDVRLSVRPENRAYALYRRLGFEESSRDETRVCLVWRSPTARGSQTSSDAVNVGLSTV